MKVAAQLLLLLGLLTLTLHAQETTVTTANGTWTLYPSLNNAYQMQVNPPINPDGSSKFASKRGVIPVKLSLFTTLGSPVFESIGSDTQTANDYSYLSFAPNTPFTFSQLTGLSAVYAFTQGDCHGGSLRWQVRTALGNMHIYYGLPPQLGNGGTGGCTPTSSGGENESGYNLIGLADLRYDTSQIAGGTFYDTYAHALELIGNESVQRVSLVLDSGWQQPDGDQKLTLGTANVTTSTGINDNFVPPSSSAVHTCDLPPAEIQVTKTAGADSGAVNEAVTVQPSDTDNGFRVVDCMYMYNLDVSSLRGSGTYKVEAIINGVPVTGPATFSLK